MRAALRNRQRRKPDFERIFDIHGFYVNQLKKDGPIYVYFSRVDYETQFPSDRVLNYVNNERCDDFRSDFDNMRDLLLLDGPHKAQTVVHAVAPTPNY